MHFTTKTQGNPKVAVVVKEFPCVLVFWLRCYNLSMPRGIYEGNKGKIPWNKGVKRPPFSEEWRKKLSNSLKGNTRAKGFVHTKETREKISKGGVGKHCGEKSNFWKGGITPVNQLIRHSLGYRLWREAVFARDNWTCIWCGARNGNGYKVILHVDHIKRFADFPELRFAIDNGRTLCVSCHRTTITYGNKIQNDNI